MMLFDMNMDVDNDDEHGLLARRHPAYSAKQLPLDSLVVSNMDIVFSILTCKNNTVRHCLKT